MRAPLARKSLYDQDFVAWTEEQAAHLRAGRTAALDLANLAEEVAEMGRSERRELDSRLEILIAHLLKKQFQPEAYTRSWDATINEQRRALRRLFEASPSLRSAVVDRIQAIYADAVARAVDETGLPAESFPAAPAYDAAEVLGPTTPTK